MEKLRIAFLESRLHSAALAVLEVKEKLAAIPHLQELAEEVCGRPTTVPLIRKAILLMEEIVMRKAELGLDYEEDVQIYKMLHENLNLKHS